MKMEILVGNIASGKSTYSLKRAREGAIIVSVDAIVLAVHGGDYLLYRDELKDVYREVFYSMMQSANVNNRDVVVDKTHMKASSRAKLLNVSWGPNIVEKIAVVFPMEAPWRHATRRTSSDSRGVSYQTWLEVAEQMHKAYEPVTLAEGFDEIVYPKWNTDPLKG